MVARFQIVIDARDPLLVAEFWRTALGYEREPAPSGYDSWQDFAVGNNIPREAWSDSAVDPEGLRPRLFFQPVSEEKEVKNRLHIDINAAAGGTSPDGRRLAVDEEINRLMEAGALVAARIDTDSEHRAVMHDPEGNEFCVQ